MKKTVFIVSLGLVVGMKADTPSDEPKTHKLINDLMDRFEKSLKRETKTSSDNTILLKKRGATIKSLEEAIRSLQKECYDEKNKNQAENQHETKACEKYDLAEIAYQNAIIDFLRTIGVDLPMTRATKYTMQFLALMEAQMAEQMKQVAEEEQEDQ